MKLNEAALREIETDANYVGGRDGAQVYLLNSNMRLFDSQQGSSLIKIFAEEALAQKEWGIDRTLQEGGVSVVRMHGIVTFSTEQGTRHGIVMDEIKGVPFGEIPKNKKASAFDRYIFEIVGAIDKGLQPSDNFWHQNVLYTENDNTFVPVLFDFSRWKRKRTPRGGVLELLIERYDCGRSEFVPRTLKEAYRAALT